MDYLTWEGIRNLATCEVLNCGDQMAIVRSDPQRPVIKWYHQRALMASIPPTAPTAGEIVYARAGWRAPWRALLVQHVTQPIVLVSAFCDTTIKPTAVDEMFQPGSPVTHWFGVQAMATHPHLTAMPLGVEGSVVPYLEAGERCATRDTLLYLNYQVRTQERAQLWSSFARRPWVTADRWTEANAAHCVSQMGRSKFVLSRAGNAWDCYRTYEAIHMGAIPIVKRQRPISDVCEDLPVLMVDVWNEISRERLEREWEIRNMRTNLRDLRTLTLGYWRERIQAMAKEVGRG